jgi:GT2 family glycosyltransferase
MTQVTICIPAYKAGDFIHHTVASALRQTYPHIIVKVAVEPPGTPERETLKQFASDPRLQVSVNTSRLGWAGNIASMLRTVETPYFMVLPHDDLIHPDYVGTLLPHLARDPSVSVAYGDIQLVAEGAIRRRRQILSEGDTFERALSFFAAGAEAPPWRGVTRTSLLKEISFPNDAFQGFLVECEWAFQLVLAGIAKRVPRTLYFKRWVAERSEHASLTRLQVPAETIRAALHDHRAKLRAHASKTLAPSEHPAILAAIDTMIAKRALGHLTGEQTQDFIETMDNSVAVAPASDSPAWRTLLAARLVVHALRAMQDGDIPRSATLAAEATALDSAHRDAFLLQSETYRTQGQTLDALWAASAAFDTDPNAFEFGGTFDAIHRTLTTELNTSLLKVA